MGQPSSHAPPGVHTTTWRAPAGSLWHWHPIAFSRFSARSGGPESQPFFRLRHSPDSRELPLPSSLPTSLALLFPSPQCPFYLHSFPTVTSQMSSHSDPSSCCLHRLRLANTRSISRCSGGWKLDVITLACLDPGEGSCQCYREMSPQYTLTHSNMEAPWSLFHKSPGPTFKHSFSLNWVPHQGPGASLKSLFSHYLI